jgi:integrase
MTLVVTMARVKDLWFSEVKGPDGTKAKRKTKRHPDNGGSRDAKRWLALWWDPNGNEASKAFKVREAAKKHANKMERDAETGEYVDPKDGKALFGPLAQKWLRLRKVGASTRSRYESVLRLHVEPTFAKRQVRSIRPSEVLDWLRKLSETHGPSTQELALLIVSGTFDLAVADRIRSDNPARSNIVDRPDSEDVEREPWTLGRVWGVVDAHPDEYRAIPISAAGLGLREGEAFGLAVEDFDFEAAKVTIRRQVARVGKLQVFKLPKHKKTRVVPLPAGVAAAVRLHMELYPPRPYSLPWLDENGRVGEDHTVSLLFRWQSSNARTHDQHVRADSYDHQTWKPALVAAGVIPPREPGKAAWGTDRRDGRHALRHWLATTLSDKGVPVTGIMQFLGHSKKNAPVTFRYTHVTEETFEAARNAVDRTLFRLRPVRSIGTETEQAVSQ